MPVATLLPFTATPRKSASPTSFRLTEKFILLLVFSACITLCFGAIFFLPDSSKLLSGVFFHSSAVETNTRTGTDSEGSLAGGDDKILAKIRKDHEKALGEAIDTLKKQPHEIKQKSNLLLITTLFRGNDGIQHCKLVTETSKSGRYCTSEFDSPITGKQHDL